MSPLPQVMLVFMLLSDVLSKTCRYMQLSALVTLQDATAARFRDDGSTCNRSVHLKTLLLTLIPELHLGRTVVFTYSVPVSIHRLQMDSHDLAQIRRKRDDNLNSKFQNDSRTRSCKYANVKEERTVMIRKKMSLYFCHTRQLYFI